MRGSAFSTSKPQNTPQTGENRRYKAPTMSAQGLPPEAAGRLFGPTFDIIAQSLG